VLEDVARNQGFVHRGIFVVLELLQRVFGDALMLRRLCCRHSISKGIIRVQAHQSAPSACVPFVGMLGCVAGGGKDMGGIGGFIGGGSGPCG
jgi:hypothetical protein